MSRRNQVRVRGNGADPIEMGTSPAESHSEDVDPSSSRHFPNGPRSAGSPERRGDDLLGFAQVAARHPVTTLLASFSVGFGLGVLATAILSRDDHGWWARQHFPESLRDLSDGLRQIPEKIARHLPDSLVRR